MTLLLQILTTISLIIGVILGEFFSTKAFGVLKKRWLYLAEIIVFVTIIVLVLSTITIENYSNWIPVLMYFILGALTIIFVRGLFTGLGVFAEHLKKEILHPKDETDYVIGLKMALERRKIENGEIKRIAKEAGFRKKTIEHVFNFWDKEKNSKNKI